ncbi:NADP-dependent 3-hydroxy acid dehydrogenase YdfG [Rhodospirillales bacterium URHD0017]|nr:NADP-dependent 3-hydroxy acid dehydrogenase YdfG [Rhodospirillales bacterium URHD0017]
MKDLAGKTAFVTGAASGIGFGIASALAQAGVKVMLCDIEEAALAAALEKLKATNADVDGVRADVSLKGELASAAEATVARYDKVHILVNNAGVGGGGPYGTWSEAAWDWTLGVNLRAVIWGIEIFGPLIERHGEGGHIVSTASIAGLISGGSTAYNVSKYGVVGLSEGLRLDLAPRGIGVSVLCPGFIRTQIVDSGRNLPQRFAGKLSRPPATGPIAERIKSIRDQVAQGLDPLYVGELVREGIENDWPYIFTDNEHEPYVDARFAAIKEGFNRIRGRIPRR